MAYQGSQRVGLVLPNLQATRRYRWNRLNHQIVDRDYGGLLIFDPLNIRYATDSTNMQLWSSDNPFHAEFICDDGYMVVGYFKNASFLSKFNPLMREQRADADLF